MILRARTCCTFSVASPARTILVKELIILAFAFTVTTHATERTSFGGVRIIIAIITLGAAILGTLVTVIKSIARFADTSLRIKVHIGSAAFANIFGAIFCINSVLTSNAFVRAIIIVTTGASSAAIAVFARFTVKLRAAGFAHTNSGIVVQSFIAFTNIIGACAFAYCVLTLLTILGVVTFFAEGAFVFFGVALLTLTISIICTARCAIRIARAGYLRCR